MRLVKIVKVPIYKYNYLKKYLKVAQQSLYVAIQN